MKNVFDKNSRTVCVYDIYIGTHNKRLKKEGEPVELVRKMICDYLIREEQPFSMCVQGGGYRFIDGAFVNEMSITMRFVDGDYDLVMKICRNLKMLLEQESVLLTKRYVEVMYI